MTDTTLITTNLERRRDVLVSSGDPRPIQRDAELHLLSIGALLDPLTVQLLKDGLAAMAFYTVTRPRFDTFGWTISLQEPPLNLFFTGSGSDGGVVGRAFLEHVQPARKNLFISQTTRPRTKPQTSSVEVDGIDIFAMLEHYCAVSDQQPVRFFHGEDDEVLLVAALPESDREWLSGLGAEEAFELKSRGDLKLISERPVTFRCGCDRERILGVVVDLYRNDSEDLFRGDAFVEAECPRCGTTHEIAREDFERVLRASGGEGRTPP